MTLFEDIVTATSCDVYYISALTLVAMQTLDKLSDANRKSFMNLDLKKLLSLHFFFETFSLPMIFISLIYFENAIINIIPTENFNRKRFFKNSNHFLIINSKRQILCIRYTVHFSVIVVGNVNGHILWECDVREIRSICIDNRMDVLLNGLGI